MREEEIIAKYAAYGRISPGGEIYLPLSTAKQFVEECTALGVAIIGLEFFHVGAHFVQPTQGILDASDVLKMLTSWQEAVKQCNELALWMLQEEGKNDETQWYNPTLYEEDEWNQYH